MRPIPLHVHLVPGANTQFEIPFTDIDGTPIDLTGKTVLVRVDPPAGSSFDAAHAEPTPTNDISVVTITGAQITAGHAAGRAWIIHAKLDGVTAALYSAMSREAIP